jgi:hypothetical protein
MKDLEGRRTNRLGALCGLFLLSVILLACRLTGGLGDGNSRSTTKPKDDRNAELCRKYDSCGCQSYDDCMAAAENEPNLEKPGIRECMLASSCDSLCAGKPDGCIGGASGGDGSAAPGRSNCAAISCSKDSDCPSDCYGGCNGVICLSF